MSDENQRPDGHGQAAPGLRERKKQRTHAAISDAAIDLFLEHGFTQVSVAQVADAAEVSKRTLFAYFPSKEDLVVHRFADHETEPAQVVRDRADDTPPLTALRDHFLNGLREHEPSTGLTGIPQVQSLARMVLETPALAARMSQFMTTAERTLAEALHESAGTPPLTARLAAIQIVSVRWALARENFERVTHGESVEERYEGAVRDAEHAFALLEGGVGSLAPPR